MACLSRSAASSACNRGRRRRRAAAPGAVASARMAPVTSILLGRDAGDAALDPARQRRGHELGQLGAVAVEGGLVRGELLGGGRVGRPPRRKPPPRSWRRRRPAMLPVLPVRRIEPGPGQESVWDYPARPGSEPTTSHLVVRSPA